VKNLPDLISELKSNGNNGLTSERAKEALLQYGENRLKAKEKKSLLQKFFEQFKDFMVIILIVAAVISFIVAFYGHDRSEFLEPLIILMIVI
jgi:Ca2+-transporting ATPase